VGRRNEYQRQGGDALRLGSKGSGRHGSFVGAVPHLGGAKGAAAPGPAVSGDAIGLSGEFYLLYKGPQFRTAPGPALALMNTFIRQQVRTTDRETDIYNES